MIAYLTPAQMGTYMADRKSYGFNSIWFDALLGAYDGGYSDARLLDGTVPFTSGSSENNYDFSTPNEAYWTEIDRIVTQAAEYGLVTILDPFDTGLTPSTGECSAKGQTGWLIAARANGPKKMHEFGRYLGNRYRNFPNIIWVLGDDFQTHSCTTGDAASDASLVANLMAGIVAADPNHLMSVELDYNFSHSSENSTLSPYLTMNGIYTYGGIYDEVLRAWNDKAIPVFAIEMNYEFDNNTAGLSPFPHVPPPCQGTPPCWEMNNILYDFVPRLQAWWTLTSGGAGEIYSNWYEENPFNFGPRWQSGIDSNGAAQIKYIAKFFATIPWQRLEPDQKHQIVIEGYGTYDARGLNQLTNNYSTTAWDPSGSLAVVYDPQGNGLTVNMAKFSQPVSASWYDPTDGAYSAIGRTPFANKGTHVFTPPGANSRGMKDWVLLLDGISSLPHRGSVKRSR